MTWSPVVAGVDASREGALAAATAWSIAQAAGAEYRLVHVAREMAKVPAVVAQAPGGGEVAERLAAGARHRVEEALRGNAQPEVVDHLEICPGNPAWVLRRVAEESKAGLLVLGGKHHTAPVRWFGGSTVHHAVRTIDVPILVTACPRPHIARILVAIDLSCAGKPTLETALRFARVFTAQIRALHVVESFPPIPDVAIQIDEQEYFRLAGEEFNELVASATEMKTVESVTRRGAPARTIAEEAAAWEADVVVVGSHGKGWVDRVLLGSATERLLNRLPTSVLVIPMRAPALVRPATFCTM